jgi:hypothetical protein
MQLLLCSGTPPASFGNDGDCALDVDNLIFFRSKSGGSWPAGVNLFGGVTGAHEISFSPNVGTDNLNNAKVTVFYDPHGATGEGEQYSEVILVAGNAEGENDGGYIDIYKDGTSPATCDFTMPVVRLTNLPTEDPLLEGQVWNNSGALKISAGPPPEEP